MLHTAKGAPVVRASPRVRGQVRVWPGPGLACVCRTEPAPEKEQPPGQGPPQWGRGRLCHSPDRVTPARPPSSRPLLRRNLLSLPPASCPPLPNLVTVTPCRGRGVAVGQRGETNADLGGTKAVSCPHWPPGQSPRRQPAVQCLHHPSPRPLSGCHLQARYGHRVGTEWKSRAACSARGVARWRLANGGQVTCSESVSTTDRGRDPASSGHRPPPPNGIPGEPSARFSPPLHRGRRSRKDARLFKMY